MGPTSITYAPNATDHMFAGTALDQALNHDEADQDQLQDPLECRRLLLEAGCDPTVAMVHVEDQSSLILPAEETFFNGELAGRIPRQLKTRLLLSQRLIILGVDEACTGQMRARSCPKHGNQWPISDTAPGLHQWRACYNRRLIDAPRLRR